MDYEFKCNTCGWQARRYANLRVCPHCRHPVIRIAVEPVDLIALQKSISAWGDATFNPVTMSNGWRDPWGTFEHLVDPQKGEVWELRRSLAEQNSEHAAEELADCFILLANIAGRIGVNLYDAVSAKMAINRARIWGAPDAHGIMNHVEDGQ
jgi:NTP pyrophosphatase (non-canonical NTP hydrolase)